MIEYFAENNLISQNISGFRPVDSINQLLSIIMKSWSPFDIRLSVREIFLDISKAFDRVWNKAFIFKLRQNGIYGDMVNILKYFLSNRNQRVILNGQCSSWADIPFGASQCFIAWPLLFLIHINNLSVGLKSECKLFAEDTCLFSVVHDFVISKNDQTDLWLSISMENEIQSPS